jgi:hypothetical protein
MIRIRIVHSDGSDRSPTLYAFRVNNRRRPGSAEPMLSSRLGSRVVHPSHGPRDYASTLAPVPTLRRSEPTSGQPALVRRHAALLLNRTGRWIVPGGGINQ